MSDENNRDDETTDSQDQDQTGQDQTDHNDGDKRNKSVSAEEFERTKAALAKANKEAQERRLKLREWEELDVNPDSIKELLQKQKDAELKEAEKKGDYEKLRQQLQNQYDEKQKTVEGKIQSMRTKLEEHLVDNAAMAAIAELDGVPRILLPHVKRNVKVVEEDGDYRVQVVDDSGTPKINSNGDFMNIKEFVGELKTDPEFGMCFRAPRQSGTGAKPGQTGNNSGKVTNNKKARSEMSTREKIDFIKENGQDAFEKLPA